MKWTREGGWHVAECACRWLRSEVEKPKLEKAVAHHLKTCKKAANT